MAMRRRVGALLDTLLKAHLAQNSQNHESELIGARQSQAADLQRQQHALEQLMGDKGGLFAARAQKAGVSSYGGQKLSNFAPNPDQTLMGPLADQVQKMGPAELGSVNADYQGAQEGVNQVSGGQLARPSEMPGQAPAGADFMTPDGLPDVAQKSNPAVADIKDLMAQRKAALDAEDASKIAMEQKLKQAAALGTGQGAGQAAHQNAPVALQDLLTKKTAEGPIDATNAGLTAGATFDAQNTPVRQAQAAKGAAQKAGAVAGAELPFQKELAQTRANTQLLNQQALDDYKRLHPHATAAQLERVAGAGHALEMSSQVRQMFDEMTKRGMTGALTGRLVQTAEGTIKSDALFNNPDDAQLAAKFFSEMGYLQKKAAQVHGGMRGASSPPMVKAFEKILSGIGDPSIVHGQLDAVDNIMKIYSDKPDAPDNLPIPGINPNETGSPVGNPTAPLLPGLQRFLTPKGGQ